MGRSIKAPRFYIPRSTQKSVVANIDKEESFHAL
jgi:hypothetical protein